MLVDGVVLTTRQLLDRVSNATRCTEFLVAVRVLDCGSIGSMN